MEVPIKVSRTGLVDRKKAKFNLKKLRLSLKYRPKVYNLIIKMRHAIKKKSRLLKDLKDTVKSLEQNLKEIFSNGNSNSTITSNNNKVEEQCITPEKDVDTMDLDQNTINTSNSCTQINECSNKDSIATQCDREKNKTHDSSTQTDNFDSANKISNDVTEKSKEHDSKGPVENSDVEKESKDAHTEWKINDNDEGKSIAEQVKEAAQSALQQTGMVYVESAGMYYDYKTGYYYNSELGLYYHTDTGCYYYYSEEKKEFAFHSYPDRGALEANASLIAHRQKKARKHKKNWNPEEEVDKLTKNLSQGDEPIRKKKKKTDKKTAKKASKTTDKKDSKTTNKKDSETSDTKMDEKKASTPSDKKDLQTSDTKMDEKSPEICDDKVPEASDTQMNEKVSGIPENKELETSDAKIDEKAPKISGNKDESKEKEGEANRSETETESSSKMEEKEKEEMEDGECSETESEESEDEESDASTSTASDDDAVAKHHPPCMRIIVRETKLPKLKVGSLFLITKDGGTIGREGDHHTILLKDHNVSRNHLDIKYDMTRRAYVAMDLGSKNGTLLNGSQMSPSQQPSAPMDIVHGSILQLGETKLLCHVHPGNDTCGHCEPGLLMETQEKEKVAYTRTCDVQTQHKLELARLRNKYAPEPLMIEDGSYKDRAKERRETVGSTHSAEKTEMADVDTSIAPENKGFKLLEKMGWAKGEGLGKDSQGDTEPVPLVGNEGTVGLGMPGSARAPQPNAPRKVANKFGQNTLRLASRSKLLKPPAKAFQVEDNDDVEEE